MANRGKAPVHFAARGLRWSELVRGPASDRELQRALSRGTVEKLAHGIYAGVVGPDGQTVAPEYAVLQGLARGPHVVSHQTAASMWGFLSRSVQAPFHISTPPGSPRIRRPGLVIPHQIRVPEEFIHQHAGVRLASPAWSWLDIALRSTEEEAIVLADQVLSTRIKRPGKQGPLACKKDLEEALVARGPASGIRIARRALALACDAVDSHPESKLRYYCQRAGLPEPVVNPLLGDVDRGQFFRPDLAFMDYQVAVQYEGAVVHSEPERVLDDVHRQEVTELLGWKEVRITKRHMTNGGALAVQKIRMALRSRGYTG